MANCRGAAVEIDSFHPSDFTVLRQIPGIPVEIDPLHPGAAVEIDPFGPLFLWSPKRDSRPEISGFRGTGRNRPVAPRAAVEIDPLGPGLVSESKTETTKIQP